MRIDALTLFPEFFEAARLGVTGRAFRELGHSLLTHSFRSFAGNAFGHVDDTPFGGGPGMVLRPDVLRDTFAALLSVGHSESQARQMIDRVLAGSRRKFKSVPDMIDAIYEQQR